MKITKQQLKKIIQEELSRAFGEDESEKTLYETKVGDILEIQVSEDGHDASVQNVGAIVRLPSKSDIDVTPNL